jgi:hypothetical protein
LHLDRGTVANGWQARPFVPHSLEAESRLRAARAISLTVSKLVVEPLPPWMPERLGEEVVRADG